MKQEIIDIPNPAEDGCLIYIDNEGNEISRDYGNKTNYVHIVPNSHFFTDLSQILESCKHKRSYEELIIGLENSIKQGYKIVKE